MRVVVPRLAFCDPEPMTEERVVEFCDEHGRSLVRLSYEPMDEDIGSLLVEMRAEGLMCDLPVESRGADGLHGFLAELEGDWKGWRGIRHWETIWQELSIDATHRGHTVELLFVLRVPYRGSEPGVPNLEVRLPIEVPPGEPLSRLTSATARLVTPFES